MDGNIRIYISDADDAVCGLAELDSRRPPTSQVLLAEVDGQPRAAKPLDGSPAFADPFYIPGHLVGLLELRVAQLRPAPERHPRLLAPFRRRLSAKRPMRGQRDRAVAPAAGSGLKC